MLSRTLLGSETPVYAVEFTPSGHGLNNSTWTTCSIQTVTNWAGSYMLFGNVMTYYFTNHGLTAATQSRGDVLIRNVQISVGTSSIVSLTGSVAMGGTLHVGGVCTAQSYVTSSDQAIKADIQDLDPAVALNALSSCNARTYIRTDIGEDIDKVPRRVGFIAQELQTALPRHITNVCTMGQDGLMKVDYSRLTSILWSVTKKQQELITNLESRVQALESTKTTAKAKKKYNFNIILFNYLFICYLYFFVKINHKCII